MTKVALDDTLIDRYFEAKSAIQKAFEYEPIWTELSLRDAREMHWMFPRGECPGDAVVLSSEPFTEASIASGKTIYGGFLCIHPHLKKHVYRKESYVLIVEDTQTDGNVFLTILRANMECTDDRLRETYRECW